MRDPQPEARSQRHPLGVDLGLTAQPNAPVGLLFYGDPGIERGVISTAWNHISPRAGIVWDPFGDGKTSIRAAGGIFYGSISGNAWNTMTNFQPWSTRLTFVNTGKGVNAAGVPQGATLSNPYGLIQKS